MSPRPVTPERAAPVTTIGLTGGIGSGKSTVAACLVDCGALLVDTDAIARELTLSGGAAVPALAQAFGAQAITAQGALDRDHMRRLVLSDLGAKARLEAILHPMIGAQAQRQAAAAAGRTVVFDVPLLAESSHWRQRVQRVLVVDCDERTQVTRVAQRQGWSGAAAERVIALQASRQARRSIADAVLHNDGITRDELAGMVQALWALWCTASGAGWAAQRA